MKFDTNIIKSLSISKRLNILIGSGVSYPGIPLMNDIKEENKSERNKKLTSKVKEVSQKLLTTELNDKDIEFTCDNYFQFLKTILELLEISNSRQTPKSVNIFSTNYDLFIENSVDQLMKIKKFIFNDGASGYFQRILSSSNYNRVVSYKGLNDNYINEIPCINLIKPHGSVNWHKCQSTDDIEILNQVSEFPVVVSPTGDEERDTYLNNHFHEMLRLFQLELDKPQSILLVIGFSFQDKHIAKMVKRAIQNPELIMFIFCYQEKNREEILCNLNLLEEPGNVKILTPQNLFDKNDGKDNFTIQDLTEILKVSIGD